METNQIKGSYKEIKVSEFIKYKPIKDQFQDGTPLVNKNRVKKLKEEIFSVLNNPTNPPVITTEDRILVGNHRRQMCEEAIEDGTLDPNRKIGVLFLQDSTSKSENSRFAIINNYGNNTTNKQPHLINSELIASKKVIAPTVRAFDLTSYNKNNKNFFGHLAIRVGSVLNANPSLADSLAREGRAQISLVDLYEAKGNKDTNLSKIVNVGSVNVDLNPMVDKIGQCVHAGVKLINRLKETGLWKEKLGDNRMLGYYIMSLSLQGRLETGTNRNRTSTDKINFAQFERVLGEEARKVKQAAKTINAGPEKSLDTLEGIFFPKSV